MANKKVLLGIVAVLLAVGLSGCGGQTKQGLYDGKSFKGDKDLNEALGWISQNVQSGRSYTIVLGGNQQLSPVTLDFGGRQATVTLKASEGGGVRKITGGSFTVTRGITLVLEDGVVLSGQEKNGVVCLDGGNLIMNGGEISGNNRNSGVNVRGGAFTMNGGTVSGNDIGVYVHAEGDVGGFRGGRNGTFAMTGGTISGNDYGVRVNRGGTFTKTGGIIYGADEPEGKRQRFVVYFCTDTGSRIQQRNTTASETTAMDAGKDGAAGGWE
jgi:hypothetical protein